MKISPIFEISPQKKHQFLIMNSLNLTPLSTPRNSFTGYDSDDHELPRFLRILFSMLNDTQCDDVIRWAYSGTAIEILNIDAMTSQVLPKHYSHQKYSSFQRQLNYFGFRKWTKTQTSTVTFSNPNFLQAFPERAFNIHKTGKRSSCSPRDQVHTPKMTGFKRSLNWCTAADVTTKLTLPMSVEMTKSPKRPKLDPVLSLEPLSMDALPELDEFDESMYLKILDSLMVVASSSFGPKPLAIDELKFEDNSSWIDFEPIEITAGADPWPLFDSAKCLSKNVDPSPINFDWQI